MKKIVLFSFIFVALVISAKAIETELDDPDDATKGRDVAKAEPGQLGQVPVVPDLNPSNTRKRRNRSRKRRRNLGKRLKKVFA
uniref:7 kDa salivary protein SP12 n=1 Tax=Phlebotomus perniciosus TaxID=13204 RepID=Q0ZS51_PHLPE|nr:7 kDa salivary protein SP12 [Phlebotomus perniciosus]